MGSSADDKTILAHSPQRCSVTFSPRLCMCVCACWMQLAGESGKITENRGESLTLQRGEDVKRGDIHTPVAVLPALVSLRPTRLALRPIEGRRLVEAGHSDSTLLKSLASSAHV